MFNVKDYAEENGVQVFGNSSAVISRVSTDSRDIKSGDLYVALIGPNFDGHSFINDAFDKGASACMVSTEPNATSMLHTPHGERACVEWHSTIRGPESVLAWSSTARTDHSSSAPAAARCSQHTHRLPRARSPNPPGRSDLLAAPASVCGQL